MRIRFECGACDVSVGGTALQRLIGAARAQLQAIEHTLLDRPGMKHPNRVDGTLLADSIDTADALLESPRIPGQLDVDDEPAASVKV